MTAKLDALRIMIVDDNAHMMQIVKTLLRGFGIKQIFEAKSAREGRDLAWSEPIDIIITDYLMEGETGLDLVTQIRTAEDSPNPYVPVIMLSAYAERSRVEEARDHGVTEFCAKPITANELYRKIAVIVDRPRSFVRTEAYFGPDRRRRKLDNYEGPQRRDDDTSGGQTGEAA